MKLTNGALSMMLSAYRSIFRAAYIRGIASAAVLTAGLSAGAANAAEISASTDLSSPTEEAIVLTEDTTFGAQNMAANEVTVSAGVTLSGAAENGNALYVKTLNLEEGSVLRAQGGAVNGVISESWDSTLSATNATVQALGGDIQFGRVNVSGGEVFVSGTTGGPPSDEDNATWKANAVINAENGTGDNADLGVMNITDASVTAAAGGSIVGHQINITNAENARQAVVLSGRGGLDTAESAFIRAYGDDGVLNITNADVQADGQSFIVAPTATITGGSLEVRVAEEADSNVLTIGGAFSEQNAVTATAGNTVTLDGVTVTTARSAETLTRTKSTFKTSALNVADGVAVTLDDGAGIVFTGADTVFGNDLNITDGTSLTVENSATLGNVSAAGTMTVATAGTASVTGFDADSGVTVSGTLTVNGVADATKADDLGVDIEADAFTVNAGGTFEIAENVANLLITATETASAQADQTGDDTGNGASEGDDTGTGETEGGTDSEEGDDTGTGETDGSDGTVEAAARMAVFGGALQAGMMASETASDLISARLGTAGNYSGMIASDNGGAGIWLAPVYRHQESDSFDADGLDYGAEIDLTGVALGLDATTDSGVRLGAMFGVGSGDADSDGNTASVSNDFDYYSLGLYSGVNVGSLKLGADLTYTVTDNDLEGSGLSADTEVSVMSLGVTAGYVIDAGVMDVTPHLGLRYSRMEMDDYDVAFDGADVASVDNQNASVFSVPFGVTLSGELQAGSWTVQPAFDLTLAVNGGDTEMDSDVVFTGTGFSTPLTAEFADDFTYSGTLGISASNGGLSLGLSAGYTGSDNTDEYGVGASVRYLF